MAYEQRNMNGSLFKNDRKEKETHPDYKGSALIDGVEYWMSSWLKTGKNGTKFMSMSFTPKQDHQGSGSGKTKPVDNDLPASFDDAEDIPF